MHFASVRFRKHRGFSLVELLVVIAIISILAGLLLPALEEALGAARTTACMGNEKQIYLGIQQYMDDFRGYCPPSDKPDGVYWWKWGDRLIWLQYLPAGREGREPHDPPKGANNIPEGTVWECAAEEHKGSSNEVMDGVWRTWGGSGHFEENGYVDGMNLISHRSPAKLFLVMDQLGWTKGEGIWCGLNVIGFRHAEQVNILHLDGHHSMLTQWEIPASNTPYWK